MSRNSYSKEEIASIASCAHAKSVTEKAVRYTSSFMGILVDEAEGGTQDIRRLRRPLAGHRQGIRDAGRPGENDTRRIQGLPVR